MRVLVVVFIHAFFMQQQERLLARQQVFKHPESILRATFVRGVEDDFHHRKS